MKKIFFLFALLASMTASATVTVTPLGVDYSTQKVTFKVEWTDTPIAPYNNRVWVWIDYCSITGTSPGTFAKAEISGATATAGSITTVSGNTRGFYVTTNPSTVSAILSNAPAGKFNWCAYGSDYPPNVTFDKGTYTFKGTTDFIISNPAQTLTTKTIVKSNLTVNSSTTFTDATGNPGIGSLYCPYTGSDLYMDATHLCQQRAAGAQNWEAWIKDTRDDELYRIVLMPDSKWWLAQNVKYAGTGSSITMSGCTAEICGRYYTLSQFNGSYPGTSGYGANKQGVCPNGWNLPITSNWETLFNSISSTQAVVAERLRANNSKCSPKPDYYGWANKKYVGYNNNNYHCHWWTNVASYHFVRIDHWTAIGDICNVVELLSSAFATLMAVRCFRQL